jgi:hypothetical protein
VRLQNRIVYGSQRGAIGHKLLEHRAHPFHARGRGQLRANTSQPKLCGVQYEQHVAINDARRWHGPVLL